MDKERIGIMGGTLDPVHDGHLRMARCALSRARLSRVLMLPSGNPPHKPHITPAEDRWRMLVAACAGEEGLEPCREELDRSGVIFTVDTLSILREKYPQAELFYLIGADMLMRLHRWYRLEDVLQMCAFIVFPRTSAYTPQQLYDERKKLTALGARIQLMDMEVLDASSTDARQAIQEGGSTSGDSAGSTPSVSSAYQGYCCAPMVLLGKQTLSGKAASPCILTRASSRAPQPLPK